MSELQVSGLRSQVSDHVSWIAGAVLAAYVAVRAVRFDTPIDRALPLIILGIFAMSWLVRRTRWWPLVQLAIPVMVALELMPLDERLRLVGIGLAAAIAFATALLADPEIPLGRAAFYTIAAIALLRWIPWPDVRVFREILVLGGAALIVAAFRKKTVTPVAVAVAIVAALVTPAVPLRTVAFPYLVAAVVWIFRGRNIRADVPGAAVCALAIALFPWSGVVSRGLPFVLKPYRELPREEIRVALSPGRSFDVALPPNARSLIVSGANVSRQRPPVTLGWIEPGHVPVTIADAADWGYMRRDQFYASRNRLPRNPAGKIRDYGYSAWVDGAGRIALPVRNGTVRVTADSNLPPSALLQIEAVEMAPP